MIHLHIRWVCGRRVFDGVKMSPMNGKEACGSRIGCAFFFMNYYRHVAVTFVICSKWYKFSQLSELVSFSIIIAPTPTPPTHLTPNHNRWGLVYFKGGFWIAPPLLLTSANYFHSMHWLHHIFTCGFVVQSINRNGFSCPARISDTAICAPSVLDKADSRASVLIYAPPPTLILQLAPHSTV